MKILAFLEMLLPHGGAIIKVTLFKSEQLEFAPVYMSSIASSNSDMASTNLLQLSHVYNFYMLTFKYYFV